MTVSRSLSHRVGCLHRTRFRGLNFFQRQFLIPTSGDDEPAGGKIHYFCDKGLTTHLGNGGCRRPTACPRQPIDNVRLTGGMQLIVQHSLARAPKIKPAGPSRADQPTARLYACVPRLIASATPSLWRAISSLPCSTKFSTTLRVIPPRFLTYEAPSVAASVIRLRVFFPE